MLFIVQAPEVDSFQQYITANGGSSNAYTAQDHTNYFFGIQNSAFNEGLDRFGHFLSTLAVSGVRRTRENAVHSEYQMQIKDDGWRGYMVSVSFKPRTPGLTFHDRFFRDPQRRRQSRPDGLFAEHYSADQMGLVVLANQSGRVRGPGYAPLQPNTQQQHRPGYPTTQAFTDLQLPAVLTSGR